MPHCARVAVRFRKYRTRAGRRLVLWALCLVTVHSLRTAAFAQSGEKALPLLTHNEQIRRLSPEQAALGYPVRVRGVITMDAPHPDFFVQDSTAGIYVEGNALRNFRHVLGQVVEIEGVTGPGKFAPVIREQKLRELSRGSLPKARLLAFSELADGQQDSQWVQMRGIVRSVAIDRKSWPEMTLAMRIAAAGGEFNLRVPISREQDLSSWVDSNVLVEGVCGSLYNQNRQLTGILFYVPRLSFIKVEAPAREASLTDLLRFSPGPGIRHRVRVRGIVAYQQLGNALFLESQGSGLRVLTQQSTPLDMGDLVEVSGFPTMGDSAPILQDAVFRRLRHEKPPEPVQLNLSRPWDHFDGALVTIEARMLNRQSQADGLRLLLQSGDVYFDAALPPNMSAQDVMSVPLNSELRITGICLVRSGGLWRIPQSFRLLLRSPQDLTVLSRPSWWNLRHTLWMLAATAFILLTAVTWVFVLGRRLQEQMTLTRQKLKTSAVLEERNRIARELHDSLEQELAGITMQLDLAVDCFGQAPRIAEQALATARNMSRHSMVEARRSVWDLRCQLLEDGDLASALEQIVAPLTQREKVQIIAKFEGTAVRLPRSVEMNLLRIGQEAVANAVKHGRARQVVVELRYAAGSVRLTVTDDGKGFAADQAAPSGHFGLLDMRERAQSMACHLQVESKPGEGARIAVEVPIDCNRVQHDDLKANTYSGG